MSEQPFVVTSINVNGIRAATKVRSEANLGLLHWLENTSADYVCLQETRADDEQLRTALAPAINAGWHVASAQPIDKGRNGVAVLSRTAPDAVRVGHFDDDFADSGRYLEADFGKLTVASVYVPSGEAGTEKQVHKELFMKSFGAHLDSLARKRRDIVICGDWNIAHTERDLKAWKTNRKNSGFLEHERAWLDSLVGEGGAWRDVVRALHPDVDGPYSWWSFRGKAFDNDAGWRIDYQFANKSLAQRAHTARVERAQAYDLRWSDHAPVTVEYR